MPIVRRITAPETVPVRLKPPPPPDDKDKDLLSAFPADAAPHVGRIVYGGTHPSDIPVADLVALVRTPAPNHSTPDWYRIEKRYRNRIRNRATGIRAFCITCAGGPRGARMCEVTGCPLWAYRTGTDPFRARNAAKIRRPPPPRNNR